MHAPIRPSSPSPRRARLRRCALATAILFATMPAWPQTAQSVGNTLNQAGHAIGALFGKRPPANAASEPAIEKLPPTAAGVRSPEQARKIALYRQLLAKGKLSGTDLYDTLVGMRADLLAKRNATLWAQLNLAPDASLNAPATGVDGLLSSLKSTIGDKGMTWMQGPPAANVVTKTLDDYLGFLLEERRAMLEQEMVSVPDPRPMTDAQVKRTVTLAALVMAARLSGKVLDQAKADLKSLDVDYLTLIKQREAAANLLFATLDTRRAALRSRDDAAKSATEADLKASLSDKDLEFIDVALDRMTLRQFSEDMGAQNLAIKYLRGKDPKAFADYRNKADDVVLRTHAYVRTVSGVAAFGTLTAIFGHTVVAIAKENNWDNALVTMPLGKDFLVAAAPLAATTIEIAAHGVELQAGSLFHSRKEFEVTAGDKTEQVSDPAAVFKKIQQAGLADQFVGALFLSDTAGWLNRVRVCDPAEAGQMVDAAVPQDHRTAFAASYFGWQDPEREQAFFFTNELLSPGTGRKELTLGDELFGRDLRRKSDSLALSGVQKDVEASYSKWNEEQLLRIIYHNREGAAEFARLDIGDFNVRPIPSADALYAYEVGVDACRKQTEAMAAANAPAAAADDLNAITPSAGKPAKPGGKPTGKSSARSATSSATH